MRNDLQKINNEGFRIAGVGESGLTDANEVGMGIPLKNDLQPGQFISCPVPGGKESKGTGNKFNRRSESETSSRKEAQCTEGNLFYRRIFNRR